MVSTRRSVLNNTPSSSVEVAPPKKLKVSTRRRRSVPNTSPSTSRLVKVAPPQKELEVSTINTTPTEIPNDLYDLIQNAAKARESLKRNPDNRSAKRKLEDYEYQIHRRYLFYRFKTEELPSGWRYDPKASLMAYVPKPPPPPKPKAQEEEKNKKKMIKITSPSEIPKDLYDLIQNAAKARKSLKRNPDNRFAKRKLEDYELMIHIHGAFYRCDTDELPDDWIYDPETSFMAHVPKPPPPPKPKTQKEEKNKKEEEEKKKRRKKKEIKITWSSSNYHGCYPLNDDYAKDVWNELKMKYTAEARDHLFVPIEEFLNMVDKDHKVVDLLGRFAVDTFNRSCQMYVNKDEANQVSGAEFMECKFFRLPKTYIFYMTMEAIEQGIPGVYETKVRCVTEDGEMTLLNFKLTDREPKWNRPWVKPRKLEVEYETVQDGSSDPQDFYELTGLVHREKTRGGFNYHNPIYSTHRIVCNISKDKTSMDFVPNITQPPSATKTIPMDR